MHTYSQTHTRDSTILVTTTNPGCAFSPHTLFPHQIIQPLQITPSSWSVARTLSESIVAQDKVCYKLMSASLPTRECQASYIGEGGSTPRGARIIYLGMAARGARQICNIQKVTDNFSIVTGKAQITTDNSQIATKLMSPLPAFLCPVLQRKWLWSDSATLTTLLTT